MKITQMTIELNPFFLKAKVLRQSLPAERPAPVTFPTAASAAIRRQLSEESEEYAECEQRRDGGEYDGHSEEDPRTKAKVSSGMVRSSRTGAGGKR